jgi:hypothetical protein
MKTLTLFAAGIAQGKKLADNARSMAAYSNEEVSIETVTDFSTMAQAGVNQLPAVAVNGRVVCQGRVPTIEELSEWVTHPEAA